MYSPTSYILAATGAVVGVLGGDLLIPAPEHEFMTVYGVASLGPMVHPDRKVHGDVNGNIVLADWRVTVVPDGHEAPTCNTIPGPNVHEGWSKYVPGPRGGTPMHLDLWVNDPGCWERLPPGDYREFTTWTPRDGSKVVTWVRELTKGQQ